MGNSLTSGHKSVPVSSRLLMNPTLTKKLVSYYLGFSFPLGKCQVPEIDGKGVWEGVGQPCQRILPVLQHGLHQLCIRIRSQHER